MKKMSMKGDHFWPSYADLMTSLFFIMMVLYILTFVKLKQDQEIFRVAAEKYEKLQEMERSLSYLDDSYFEYDNNNKRYRMKTDMRFVSGSSNINDIPMDQLIQLKEAGKALYDKMVKLSSENPSISYLIVLEGNNAHWQDPKSKRWNYEIFPNKGYTISYGRALALYDFWKKEGFDFKSLKNCEMLLAGSGYFGKSRDLVNEAKNKRFTIQITGKIGEFK